MVGGPALSGSVAVVPFINISRDAADDWIGDGIAETVMADLELQGDLTLIAQASADGPEPIYGYTVRREKKDHGRGQKIDQSWHPDGEPLIRPGRRVALVDDVITTGGSTIEALEEVKAAGCDVRAVAAIVDRGAGGAERFAELGVPFYSLVVADEDGKLGPGRSPD